MLNFGQSAIFSVGLTAIMVLASQGIVAGKGSPLAPFVDVSLNLDKQRFMKGMCTLAFFRKRLE